MAKLSIIAAAVKSGSKSHAHQHLLAVPIHTRNKLTTKRQIKCIDPANLLPRCPSPIERLDVARIQSQSVGAVTDDLVELVEIGVARRSIAVEDGLLLALDRFRVEFDRLREVFGRVGFVPASLENEGELGSLLEGGNSEGSAADIFAREGAKRSLTSGAITSISVSVSRLGSGKGEGTS